MPCLAGRFDAGTGLILNIGVLSPGPVGSTPPTLPQETLFPALIDTGASITCISPNVASALELRPLGMRPMVSATHVVPVHVYLVDLVIPFGEAAGYLRQGTQVMEFAPPVGSPFQILLGRDVICGGILTISFDGHFSFAL